MVKNDRIPLKAGTELTKELVIISQVGCGGTSLVYKAKNRAGRVYMIKEMFPLQSEYSFVRRGNILLTEASPEAKADAEKLGARFIAEIGRANTVSHSEGSNSLFHFECADITDEVAANPQFKGTAARYMLMSTLSGRTLCQIEQSGTISLKQALLYTKKILYSLSKMHGEPMRMLHLDIKPDNIFFPDDLPPEETFAIILDMGSAQSAEDLPDSDLFSISEGYSAAEIRKLRQYSARFSDASAAEKYRSLICPATDIYSVGAILLELTVGGDIYEKYREMIGATSMPEKKHRLIRAAVGQALGEKYPYVLTRLSRMLARAMYFSPIKERMLENRYSSCGEFIADIDLLLDIIENRGMHHEIIAENSRRAFAQMLRNSNIGFEGDPVKDDGLFVSDWFGQVEEEE